ncbi:MAG TPA: DUF3793 family protein [Clostridia bacterium]|nr:DUF3793 family protein [Clostridia bacterium]
MNEVLIEFTKKLREYGDEDYLEAFYSFLLAPVITGAKPASILTIKDCIRPMFSTWCCYGEEFLYKMELSSKILKELQNGIVVIIFSDDRLRKHLAVAENQEFLSSFGYENDFDISLNKLLERYKNSVPPECGIFLGIPKEDVEGYISKKQVALNGYWKVYGNIDRAIRVFDIYDNSKKLVMENILQNKKLQDFYKEIINIY